MAFLVFLAVSTGSAFAGSRQGPFVDLNLGYGITSITYDIDLNASRRLTKGAFFLDFKVGYAPNDRLKLSFVDKMAIFDLSKAGDDYDEYFDEISKQNLLSVIYVLVSPVALAFIPYESSHSLLGGGITYYLEDDAPSWYFEGGIGISFVYNPLNVYTLDETGVVTYNEGETGDGPGAYLGVGYEFDRHFQASVSVMYGRFDAQDKYYTDAVNFVAGPEETFSALTFTTSIGISFY